MKQLEYIYESMIGELVEPCPEIENAFAPGQRCAALYEEIFQANMRLCQRLGVEEDPDVECIINNFFTINRELCIRMYQYGIQAKK